MGYCNGFYFVKILLLLDGISDGVFIYIEEVMEVWGVKRVV